MTKRICSFLFILASCHNKICKDSQPNINKPILIVFERGFDNDMVVVEFNDSTFFKGKISTNSSSGTATDFIGLYYKNNSSNILKITLNKNTKQLPFKDYACYKTIVFRKQNNKL